MNTYKWLCFHSPMKWRHTLFPGWYCLSSHLSSYHPEVDFASCENLTGLSDPGTLKMDKLLKVYFLSISLRSARLVLTLPKSLCLTGGNKAVLYVVLGRSLRMASVISQPMLKLQSTQIKMKKPCRMYDPNRWLIFFFSKKERKLAISWLDGCCLCITQTKDKLEYY